MGEYSLDQSNEFERLEKQSKNPNYDCAREAMLFRAPANGVILDAGCGSGVLSRHLAKQYPHLKVIGCDLSVDRVALARDSSPTLPNLRFQAEDISQMNFPDDSISAITCRYVFQHLDESTKARVLQEFMRVLRPGGTVLVIDADGIMQNLFPKTSLIETVLEQAIKCGAIHPSIGRELPSLLSSFGFKDIFWQTMPTSFSNKDQVELDLMSERLSVALPFLSKMLGDWGKASHFCAEFIETMRRPESVYFHNVISISAVKPSNISLVKA